MRLQRIILRRLLHNKHSIRFFRSKPVNQENSSAGVVKVHSALELGCIDYSKSWAWQHILLSRRLELRRQEPPNEDFDCILLLELSPVYTLGRGSDENHIAFLKETNPPNAKSSKEQQVHLDHRAKLSRKNRGPGTARLAVDRHHNWVGMDDLPMNEAVDRLLGQLGTSPVHAPNQVPIYRVERGGEVTFHGPSQLVVYPLLDLRRPPYRQDLHWYLRKLEQVVIQTLQNYNIESTRDKENTGVWVGDNKIAAVGISSSRWITTHGFALNVNPDLAFFDTSLINPCGIEGKGVTSIANVWSERSRGGQVVPPTLQDVANVVVKTMENVFGVQLEIDKKLQ